MIHTEHQIELVIKDFIKREFWADQPEMSLDNDVRLIEEGLIDSLGILLLIGHIDKEFEIKIQQEDVILENFETVNAIKALVVSKLLSGSAKAKSNG